MAFKDAADKDLTLKFDKATKKPNNTFEEITTLQSKRYQALKERFDKVEMEKKKHRKLKRKPLMNSLFLKQTLTRNTLALPILPKKNFLTSSLLEKNCEKKR